MRKASPKVRLYLARQALERYYRGYELINEEQEEQLRELYEESPENKGLMKIRMRLLCRECSEIIVGAVIAEASQHEKIFLRDKYKLHRNFTAIGCKLHMHTNGLQRWRDKFLTEIAQLMNYELPERDIWSHRKVSALVKALERNIEFLGTYGKGADEESLSRLHGLRDKYGVLLAGMDKYLQSPEDSVGSKVVRARVLHVEMNSKELAELVGYSHTTVDMYLGEFLKEYYAGGTN